MFDFPGFPKLRRRVLILFLFVTVAAQASYAQKLPSAEKIVDNYLKASGGKKAVGALRDATYEWTIQLNNQPIGTARTQRKAPASERFELTFGNGQIVSAANARSAWEIGLDGQLRTLTGPDSSAAKLRASLDSSRLVNFKKANILARVLSLGDLASEPSYIVEFSTRSGARFQYYFSVKTSLITKITGDVRKTRVLLEDYRVEQGILEPDRVRMNVEGSGETTLQLHTVKYTTRIHGLRPRTSTSSLCFVKSDKIRTNSRIVLRNMHSNKLRLIARLTARAS